MQRTTQITFTAADNGVDQLMSRYRQSAVNIAREMAESAQRQTTDGKEMMRIIEEQIRLMERRARTSLVETRTTTRDSLDRGEITQGQANIAITGAVDEYTNELLQTRILRDIFAQLQQSAREELRSDRDNVDATLRATQEEDQQDDSQDRDNLAILQRNIQRSLGGGAPVESEQEDNEDEDEGGSRFARGRQMASNALRSTTNAVSSTALQRNEFYAFAALTSILPVVGQGISSLMNRALGQAEQFQAAQGGLNSLNVNGVNAPGFSATAYGVTSSQFMSQYAMAAARAQGSTRNLQSQGMDILEAEKQAGISSGSSGALLRSMRNDPTTKSLGQAMDNFVRAISTGDISVAKGDLTKLDEYLGVVNSLSASQIQSLNSVNTTLNSAIVGSFAKIGGNFSDPQVIQGIVQGINNSLSKPSSQYAQALQFSVLSQQNPNASRFDLMQMQEQGIAAPGLLSGVLSTLQKSSGSNKDLMKEQVLAMFPSLSANQVGRLVDNYQDGTFDPTFQSAQSGGMNTSKLNRGGLTGALQSSTAEIDNVFAAQGAQMVGQIQQLLDHVGGMGKAIDTLLGWGVGFLESMNTIANFFGAKSTMPNIKTNVIKGKDE